MLVDNFKTGDIVSVKLVSGEEIIGRLVERQTTYISLTSPLLVALEIHREELVDANGEKHMIERPEVVFAPFILGHDNTKPLPILTHALMAIVKAKEDGANSYLGAIGAKVE